MSTSHYLSVVVDSITFVISLILYHAASDVLHAKFWKIISLVSRKHCVNTIVYGVDMKYSVKRK